MSNIGIAGFERYHKDCDEELRLPTREELAEYFELVFYHKPTKEQLEVFHKVLIDEEKDVEKALDFCEQDFDASNNEAERGKDE